jgi:virginiamycin B lyase
MYERTSRWFTECARGVFATLTTTGVISTYKASPSGAPFDIIAGPGGNLWFTEPIFGRIGRNQ